jgi:hypothetical protein
MHLSCTDTNTVSKQEEMRLHMTHVTLVFCRVCPKRFLSLWYVRHKLCTNLMSRLALSPNRPSFHLSLFTEYHWVRGKWFLSQWYVWHKLCTYLTPTLTLSSKRKKWDSTWPTSPRNSIGCVQNDFEPMICSTQSVHLSCVKISNISKKNRNELSYEPRHLVVPSSASKMISEPMMRLAQTMLLPCTDTNTVFKRKEVTFHMTHIT